MKKILLSFMSIFCAYFLNAQNNNPYDQTGVDFVSSLNIIIKDFKEGKIKDFSKEAIDNYTQKLPLKVTINPEMAANVITSMKSKDFSLEKVLNESSFSERSKKLLHTIAFNPEKFDKKQMHAYLEKEVDDIKVEDISEEEKQFVLSTVAIAYRASGSNHDPNHCECTVEGPNGSGPIDCVTCGVIMGGVIGWWICGPLCGLGGAIIGGIAGALS